LNVAIKKANLIKQRNSISVNFDYFAKINQLTKKPFLAFWVITVIKIFFIPDEIFIL